MILAGTSAALLGLLLYTGARLGWWAETSHKALEASMGPAGLVERCFLLALLLLGVAWIAWHFVPTAR